MNKNGWIACAVTLTATQTSGKASACQPWPEPSISRRCSSQRAQDGFIDPHDFISNVFIQESIASYYNAAGLAGINLVTPYPETYLDGQIDYDRIRAGENKYLVREVFNRLFPGFEVPPKTPMPRPVAEWLKDWDGPEREEFWPHCAVNLKGDQKWLLWILEKYLDMQD